MKRPCLKWCLWAGLALAVAFAAWVWLWPYEWNPDHGANCEIQGVALTIDRSYFWVEAHLTVNPKAQHDLSKPVFLQTAQGHRLEPADSTFASPDGQLPREIWFKFWLDSTEIAGPLSLHLNGGKLLVKSNSNLPTRSAFFTSHRW